MDALSRLVQAVKASVGLRLFSGHVITVVGEGFARRQTGRFADNFVSFYHGMSSIYVLEHPLATEKGDRSLGAIVDGDKVDEGVGFVRWQAASPMMVDQFVESSGEPGEGRGGGHVQTKRRTQRKPEKQNHLRG